MQIAVLVGAENSLRPGLSRALEDVGAQCEIVTDADALVTAALLRDFDLVLLDPDLRCTGAMPPVDLLRNVGVGVIIAGLDVAGRPSTDTPAAFDAVVAFPFEAAAIRALFSRAIARRVGAGPFQDCFNGVCADLAVDFRANLPGTLDALEAAANAGDFAQLQTLVHRLKGVAGPFGFPDLAACCARVETQLRSGSTEGPAGETLRMTAVVRAGLAAGLVPALQNGGDREYV